MSFVEVSEGSNAKSSKYGRSCQASGGDRHSGSDIRSHGGVTYQTQQLGDRAAGMEQPAVVTPRLLERAALGTAERFRRYDRGVSSQIGTTNFSPCFPPLRQHKQQ